MPAHWQAQSKRAIAGAMTYDVLAVWLGDFVRLAFVAIVAALVTSFLSRRQQVSQLWWQRKADAYIEILSALSEMTAYYEAHYEKETHEADYSKKWMEQLGRRWEQAHRHIDRAVRIGDFLISVDAHAALKRMREAGKGIDPGNFFGRVDADYAAALTCMRELRGAARADLQRGLGWRSLWSAQL